MGFVTKDKYRKVFSPFRALHVYSNIAGGGGRGGGSTKDLKGDVVDIK